MGYIGVVSRLVIAVQSVWVVGPYVMEWDSPVKRPRGPSATDQQWKAISVTQTVQSVVNDFPYLHSSSSSKAMFAVELSKGPAN